MTAEPNPEPGTDQEPAALPPDEPRPTFQTPQSEAADVAARAVAERVAAAAAASAAAAEEAAAREAEAVREAEAARAAAEAATAATIEASAADVAAVDPGSMPGPEYLASTPADASTSMTADVAQAPDASMAPAAEMADPAATPAVEAAAMPIDAAAMPAVAAGTAPTPEAAAPTSKPSRRPILLAWARRVVIFVISIVFLVGGVLLGASTFQRTRPVPAGIGAIEFSQPPADVAKEFIAGLAAGDADAVRSSLMPQPNKDLTDEFTKFGIQKVTGVETLGTAVDGTRSATEVLLHTTNTDGNKFDINLIILVQGNQIEGFR